MPTARWAIGIDLGGTNLRVARVDQDGEVAALRSERVAPGRESQLDRIHALIRELAGSHASDHGAVSGIGIGVAGRVRQCDGQVLTAGFLDLAGVPLGEMLEEQHGVPVVVDNDAHMAMFGELQIGAARGCQHAVMFTIGTGIGGAVVTDGSIYYGHGIAGQLGHLAVESSDRLCRCGRFGCIETYSSGAVLNSLIAEAGLEPDVRADTLLAMARSGDQVAAGVLRRWATPLATAIDSVMAALDPELVVLGGGLGHIATEALESIPLGSDWFGRPVVDAQLGDRAGVIGAALKAMATAAPHRQRAVIGTGSRGATSST